MNEFEKKYLSHVKWLTGFPGGERGDFSYMDLTGFDAGSISWSGKLNLSQADFTGACLAKTHFAECNFKGACFIGASFNGASFFLADLRNSNMQQACGEKTYFGGCDLRDVDFTGSRFKSSSFSGANLLNIKLDDALFSVCDFRGAALDHNAIKFLNVRSNVYDLRDFEWLVSSFSRLANRFEGDSDFQQYRIRSFIDGLRLRFTKEKGIKK